MQEFLDEEAEYENNPDRVIALEARKPTVVEDVEGEEEFLMKKTKQILQQQQKKQWQKIPMPT